MADIHSPLLTFKHSLVTTLGFRSLRHCIRYLRTVRYTCAQRSFASGTVISPLTAPTTSCASPRASAQLRFYTRWSVFAAWTTRCWSLGPSRRYLSPTFPWMPGLLPRLSQWCLYPFLPTELRPSGNGYTVGSLERPAQRLQCGPLYRAAVIP